MSKSRNVHVLLDFQVLVQVTWGRYICMKKKTQHSCIQIAGIRTFCLLGHILGLWALRYSELKNQTRKINKINRNFELFQVFMYQTVLIIPKIYIIHKKN